LPDKTVTVDTADWQLSSDDSVPSLDCSSMPEACSAAVSEFCGADACFGSCGEGDTCEATVLISLWNRFDLKNNPEISMINDKPLVDVRIERIWYQVSENTFNVASPPLQVYVAPQMVMSPGSPQAERIGTIPPVDAGVEAVRDLELTADGEASMAKFMRDYKTPFNIIVGGEVDLQAGDSMPQGRLAAVVHVSAVASP
jgi:hypothetical protein